MNRYVQTRFLGSGAYSNVYEAIDKDSGRAVALKVCKLSAEEGFPSTSLREISILKNCKHPNIIELLDIQHADNILYLVFEFMDYDLKKFLDQHQVDVIPYIHQMLSGVAALHSKNLIHRDLKPQNILVNKKGVLKIADFGLGRSIDLAIPHMASEVVTLWYRSPELLQKADKYAHYIDMWSVGCIIVEMISGDVLFCGKTNEKQLAIIANVFKRGLYEHIAKQVGTIPEYLMNIICGCLNPDVEKRYTAMDCLKIMEM